MTLSHDDVQGWLDRYVEAWQSYDPGAIGDLFSADADYRYHPNDEPVRGRDAIVADWLSPAGSAGNRDAAGTFAARYEPWAVEGDRAVAVGTSTYYADASQGSPDRIYDNCFLLEFDADGRCRSFTELFVQRPAA